MPKGPAIYRDVSVPHHQMTTTLSFNFKEHKIREVNDLGGKNILRD